VLVANDRLSPSVPYDLHDRIEIAAVHAEPGPECVLKIVKPKPYLDLPASLDLPAIQAGLLDRLPETIGEDRKWFSLVV
jgi:hypothetical protein